MTSKSKLDMVIGRWRWLESISPKSEMSLSSQTGLIQAGICVESIFVFETLYETTYPNYLKHWRALWHVAFNLDVYVDTIGVSGHRLNLLRWCKLMMCPGVIYCKLCCSLPATPSMLSANIKYLIGLPPVLSTFSCLCNISVCILFTESLNTVEGCRHRQRIPSVVLNQSSAL